MTDSQSGWTTAIYAGGCAGITTAAITLTELKRDGDRGAIARQSYYFIDTNDKRAQALGIDPEDLYLVEGEGGGKLRGSEASLNCVSASDHITLARPPCDFNIILHSSGGSTGSSLGPAIADHLGKKRIPLVVILIVGKDSEKDITNTLETLSDYQSIAVQNNLRIPVVIVENRAGFADANRDVCKTIRALDLLFSGETPPIDKIDITNFLDFSAVSPDTSPGLYSLTISSKLEDIDGDDVFTACVIAPPLTSTSLSFVPIYKLDGVAAGATSLGFFTLQSPINQLYLELQQLSESRARAKTAKAAIPAKKAPAIPMGKSAIFKK